MNALIKPNIIKDKKIVLLIHEKTIMDKKRSFLIHENISCTIKYPFLCTRINYAQEIVFCCA